MRKRDEKTLESAAAGSRLDAQATGLDDLREPKAGRRRAPERAPASEDESASQASRSTQRRRDDL